MVTDIATAIYVSDLNESKQFYVQLLGLEVVFDSDWVVQLSSPLNDSLNLTLQPRTHEFIPKQFQQKPQGMSITFVVEDADVVYETALSMNLEIIQPPTDEIYGQRRFLTVDPDGLLIDVSSQCEPSAEFVEKYFS